MIVIKRVAPSPGRGQGWRPGSHPYQEGATLSAPNFRDETKLNIFSLKLKNFILFEIFWECFLTAVFIRGEEKGSWIFLGNG